MYQRRCNALPLSSSEKLRLEHPDHPISAEKGFPRVRAVRSRRKNGAKSHIASMILTVIPREQLDGVLDRFTAKLEDAGLAFRGVRRFALTSADRRRRRGSRAASGEQHFHWLAASGWRSIPRERRCAFNWDGRALNSATEAYVILHEAAHFVLAPSERRRLVDFGLGPGPDTRDRDAARQRARRPLSIGVRGG